MNLQEIKQAVNEGKKVHWATTSYIVLKDKHDQWFIQFQGMGNNSIGLTWQDGKTMNGEESQFFIGEQKHG